MKRPATAWTATATAVAAVAAVAAGVAVVRQGGGSDADGPAAKGAAASPGRAGTGQVLPHPGPDGLIWIADWIGNGGAASGGANPSGQPVTITLACLGDRPGEARVVFTSASGKGKPTEFTVTCPPGTTGTGSTTVAAPRAVSYSVGVTTSDPGLHWGLTVTQPDS
ncbi:hypothetical protein [Kitasatospora sp. NPDC057198]|uniref:hypothetical protein n=1 Tax=Kitasatospora sp. NPDC057198 TaxID=3346046 RepID=UPI00363FC930